MALPTEEVIKKIHEDEDFINIKRFNFSLANAQARFPDGAPNKVIASALVVNEDDVPAIYQEIIEKLRKLLKI